MTHDKIKKNKIYIHVDQTKTIRQVTVFVR